MIEAHADRPNGRDPDTGSVVDSGLHEQVSLFVFRLAQSLYAFAADKVDHISATVSPVRVPTSPPHFLGIVLLRGQVVTVVDLPAVLQLTREADPGPAHDQRLLVLRAGERAFAVIADAVLGLHTVAKPDIREVEATEQQDATLLQGQVPTSDGVVTVLSEEKIATVLTGGQNEPERFA